MQIPYPATSFRHKIAFVCDPLLWAVAAADGEVNLRPHIRSRMRTGASDKIAACFSYHPGARPFRFG